MQIVRAVAAAAMVLIPTAALAWNSRGDVFSRWAILSVRGRMLLKVTVVMASGSSTTNAENAAAKRAEQPIILIRGFGGLGTEDEKKVAYQGFNDGTVYPRKSGEHLHLRGSNSPLYEVAPDLQRRDQHRRLLQQPGHPR